MISFLKKPVVGLALASMLMTGCMTTDPYTGEQKISNATLGTGLGAATGAIIGNLAGGDTKATLIGAGVGALAGGGLGSYMDSQESELRASLQSTGVSVTRSGDYLYLNMPSNITFDVDSANIKREFAPVLVSVARVLNKYPRSMVEVSGHTDNTGDPNYNNQLSLHRANAVTSFLAHHRVHPSRLHGIGYGESQPIASNRTVEGRQLNRRVEIKLSPMSGQRY